MADLTSRMQFTLRRVASEQKKAARAMHQMSEATQELCAAIESSCALAKATIDEAEASVGGAPFKARYLQHMLAVSEGADLDTLLALRQQLVEALERERAARPSPAT